jgi:hypothetical protein
MDSKGVLGAARISVNYDIKAWKMQRCYLIDVCSFKEDPSGPSRKVVKTVS